MGHSIFDILADSVRVEGLEALEGIRIDNDAN